MRIVVASGYFDPLHVGHVEYLQMAKKLGDKLIVIVNNDKQAKLKKGKSFISQDDRIKIVGALRVVDEVFLSIDKDLTVCQSIEAISPQIFAKGGDRFSDEIPEAAICHSLGISIIDGLGNKIAASSDIVKMVEASKNELV